MAKLIIEEATDVKFITEAKDEKKTLYIEGVFMQYDTPNRNNRIYSKRIMEAEVNRYVKEHVNKGNAVGELNHPNGPNINLDRVTHLIEKLEVQPSGIVYGRAKVFDTDHGRNVRALIEGGMQLGVSSRGLGSLKEGQNGIMEVQEDFRLVTAADIVADPSAPQAYVRGIMEGVDWVFNEATGEYIEQNRKEIRKMSISQIREKQMQFLEGFLKTL